MNLRAIALVIPASIALVGCSNTVPGEATPTTEVLTPAPVQPTTPTREPTLPRGGSTADVENSAGDPITDQAFEEMARENGYVPRYGSMEELRSLAVTVCQAFDSGASFTDILQAAMGNEIPAGDAGGMIGMIIAAYCPEHAGVLQ